MKRLFIAVMSAALLFSGTAFAQLSVGEGRWLASGGYTTFSLKGTDAGNQFLKNVPAMPGFYFGASLDYAFSTISGLSVEPGAYIQHYGKAYSFGLTPEKKSYHANYLSIPINLKYTFPMPDSGVGIAVFTGPRFNIGLGGNMFSAGKNYPGLMLVDAQWGVGLAVSVQEAVSIRASYDTGLTKAIKDNKDLSFDDLIVHRNTLNLGVAFAF